MNPYVPGQPATPDTFAGREAVIRRAEEALELANRLRRNSAILLSGYRGSGKTSMLRKIEAVTLTTRPGALVVEVPLRVHSSEDRLLASIVEEVARQLEGRSGPGERVRAFLSRIQGLSVAGTGVAVGPSSADRRTTGLAVWRECIESLPTTTILVVCVDDAELLDASGLGALKTVAETHGGAPIVLVVSGGVELSDRLSQPDTSPIARIFSAGRFDIGELSLSETADALNAPIRSAGLEGGWSPDAIELVHRLSRGYPFLVQCLAHASFAEGAMIDTGQVQGAIPGALEVGGSWLERECASASDEDIRAFAKIADASRPRLRSSEILSLGIQSPYIGRLVRQKILKKISRGQYELRKAPVIAYYHALARGLRLS
jgi:hypothetical protein